MPAAILDQLAAPHFVTAGWSGGGPHALACAVLLPGRCLAAATIAGVAPHLADGLDWLAGMAQENVAEFSAARQGEAALSRLLSPEAALLAQVTPEQVTAALGGLVSEVDRAALTGGYAAFTAESFRAAVAAGIAGWRDDDLAFVSDWGLSLDSAVAAVPVSIWQGDQDAMVPFAHGIQVIQHGAEFASPASGMIESAGRADPVHGAVDNPGTAAGHGG